MAGPKLAPARLSTNIPAMFTTGLFFGLYLVAYAFANRWLLFTNDGWRLRKRYHLPMVALTNVVGILLLVDVALSVWLTMSQMGFIGAGHKPSEYVDPPWDAIVKCTISNVIALLSDTALIYRVWVVYKRQMWVTWFPALFWLGGVGCTILQIYLQIVHIHNKTLGPYQWAGGSMTEGPGIILTPFWTSTIALNIYCTGLLGWQIWKSPRDMKGDKSVGRRVQFLVRAFMDSGVLYLLISLAHFLVWFGKDGFSISLLGFVNAAVIPIAFQLMLIRTAQDNVESMDSSYTPSTTTAVHLGSEPSSMNKESRSWNRGRTMPSRENLKGGPSFSSAETPTNRSFMVVPIQ